MLERSDLTISSTDQQRLLATAKVDPDLASTVQETRDMPRRERASKAKGTGKGKGKRKVKVLSEDDASSTDDADQTNTPDRSDESASETAPQRSRAKAGKTLDKESSPPREALTTPSPDDETTDDEL